MEGLGPQWGGAGWGPYPEVEAGDGLLRRVVVQLLWVREGKAAWRSALEPGARMLGCRIWV